MNLADELLKILIEFGGGQGGEPGNVAVRFLLPTFFWSVLAYAARQEWRQRREKKDLYIAVAALVGIGRELLMFTAEYGGMRGFVSFPDLYPYYPPQEHAATMLSGIFLAAAFLNYLPELRWIARRYFVWSTAVTLLLYAVTAALWPRFLREHPGAAFGSFPGDMSFRVAAACILGIPLVLFVRHWTRGRRIQVALLLGFAFLFLDEFLMIFNLATQERHVNMFAPIRHNLHIWAIPLLLGVYWTDLQRSLAGAIDEIRKERSRSDSIIAAMGDGISIVDTGLTIQYQNQIHKDLYGSRVGEYCYKAFEGRNTACRECPVVRTFRDGKIHRREKTVPRPEGTRHIEITASPLRDGAERIIAAVEVVRDITERRRLQEELIRSDKLESIGLLAGGLAHDFNNLLTSIFGNISLAKGHIDRGSKAYDRLVDAETASRRAADLTSRLLTFSRGGAPIKQTASIVDVIRESVGFTLSGSRVRAVFTVAEAVPFVEVDAGQMSQVFNNLALNAMQAMPGGGTVTITIESVSLPEEAIPPLPAGPYVRILVSDTGLGIPAEHLPRIFDPYFTTKQQGTGLGLSTVYSIIRKHDGHITVESAPGAGTVFHIYLQASSRRRGSATAAGMLSVPGRGKVLVMDDEKMVLDIAGNMLKELGYEFVAARDGAQAVMIYGEALESGRPFDAVIMDLTIPGGMGGVDALKMLLKIDPGVRAIVSSGYSNDTVLADYKKYGFVGVIAKPYNIDTMSWALLAALTERAAGPDH